MIRRSAFRDYILGQPVTVCGRQTTMLSVLHERWDKYDELRRKVGLAA